MNSSAACLLLVTLGLVLISQFPVATHARGYPDTLVSQICKETSEMDNCMKLLTAAGPSIVNAKDFTELSKAVLTLALNKGVEAQNFLKGLAQIQNSTALTQCANFYYNGMVGTFRSALGEITAGAQTANYDVSVAVDGPVFCGNLLASEKINNPAIDAINQEMMLLSSVSDSVTSRL
ncbi:hypothetical protein Fmac_023705 [Flemingia macrophylla]|uniref:Pectinesterase inhibitor domain-containing protein n=1 Tax=Flemingia macrophylla TaxID=520843 RepID=A0ABD1LMB8_9FABA